MIDSADIQLATPPSLKIPKNNERALSFFSPYVSITQSAITCSKSTLETLEQGVKSVRVNNNDARTKLVTTT